MSPDHASGAVAFDENVEPAPAEPAAAETAAAAPARTPAHPPLAAAGEAWAQPSDPGAPAAMLNREMTWLIWIHRVVHEAEDPRTPLLERVKFLGIVGTTLDEFFMKRIGGLKHQLAAGVQALTVDGRTPGEQIAACHRMLRGLSDHMQVVWRQVAAALEPHDIGIVAYGSLPPADQLALRDDYFENVFPLVTPQAMDPAHPFPFISNLSLNLLVTLHYPNDAMPLLARIKVPTGGGIPRLRRVGTSNRFVLLEDVIAHNLDLLFPGMVIEACMPFRVTRNAVTEGDEDLADDLMAMIQSEVRERKFAPIVRMQIARSMPQLHRNLLAAKFGLSDADVFEVDGVLGMRDLEELAALDIPALHDPPHAPVDHPEFGDDRNVFHQIRDAGSILVHHPYDSFTSSVERFLCQAAEDPKVRAIKMTLYRTSADSQVVKSLILAARNGKQVAVVVEIKARFDEEANIGWANRLEEVGIHVSYGVVGLKTHCKVILVVRSDSDRLRRYTHVGTGNYHAGTARGYTDLGLFTSDEHIGRDMTELFNYLTTGYRPKRRYGKILIAPKLLEQALLDKIEREIAVHRNDGGGGLIQLKLNALEDSDVTTALYRASQAGVRVDLIVRDSCRLRPRIPGLSEHVRVISIVGRFLEHSRIYYFRNGGAEEYYIGSADCMKRNLESRIETLVPVESGQLRRELRAILKLQLGDQRSAWEMQSDGSFVQRQGGERGSQEMLIERAERRHREATRLRRRRPRPIAGTPER
ncbi:MAG TPA: polyphosphate kinase 1 [Nannocystaceae bacterium]|nr:polyphosphate kinase 1 [Nannocystaceae bacterium]